MKDHNLLDDFGLFDNPVLEAGEPVECISKWDLGSKDGLATYVRRLEDILDIHVFPKYKHAFKYYEKYRKKSAD